MACLGIWCIERGQEQAGNNGASRFIIDSALLEHHHRAAEPTSQAYESVLLVASKPMPRFSTRPTCSIDTAQVKFTWLQSSLLLAVCCMLQSATFTFFERSQGAADLGEPNRVHMY